FGSLRHTLALDIQASNQNLVWDRPCATRHRIRGHKSPDKQQGLLLQVRPMAGNPQFPWAQLPMRQMEPLERAVSQHLEDIDSRRTWGVLRKPAGYCGNHYRAGGWLPARFRLRKA